jgi:hypothetical protein
MVAFEVNGQVAGRRIGSASDRVGHVYHLERVGANRDIFPHGVPAGKLQKQYLGPRV